MRRVLRPALNWGKAALWANAAGRNGPIIDPMTLWRITATVLLLAASNAFMTFAWYYHVKKPWPLLTAIGLSWLIALPEYCLQVPANRLGHVDHGGPMTLPQLKVLQEAITLAVFIVFTIYIAGEKPRGTDLAAFGLIFAAVGVAMWGRMSGG